MVADLFGAKRVINVDANDLRCRYAADRRFQDQPPYSENLELIYAATNQSVCSDLAWALLALEQ